MIAAEMTSLTPAAEAQGIPESTLADWLETPRWRNIRAKTREDLAERRATLAQLASAP